MNRRTFFALLAAAVAVPLPRRRIVIPRRHIYARITIDGRPLRFDRYVPAGMLFDELAGAAHDLEASLWRASR